MTSSLPARPPSKGLRIGLWCVQALLALVYIPAGAMKLFSPVAQGAAQIPWAGDVPEAFLRLIGVVDLSAGLGLLLPALTRIAPRLTVWAAIGSIALQICAMLFHISRGEYPVVPMNLTIIALSAYVAWGRARRVPIAPRGAAAMA
jgi:uncharacterized membrane protein YphA (DoxX/SURF4 family)